MKTKFDKLPLGLSQHTMGVDHYDDSGNEVLLHQPDCLKCKVDAFWRKWGVK